MIQPERQIDDLPESGNRRPELNLFLKMPYSDEPKRSPGRLASLLGLHVYSETLLTKRVRIEMNFAAFILLIVSAFELLAWSFLFNAIFNSDILYFGWKTIPAVLVAALFASAVLWFERQFLTNDESQRRQALRAAAIRLIFIFAAGITTAQPLELLFFRKPVQKRIHEEGIRKEVVERLNTTREDLAIEDKYGAETAERKARSVAQIQAELGNAERNRLGAELNLGGIRSMAQAEERLVGRLQKEMATATGPRAEDIRQRYSTAVIRFNRLSSEALRLEAQVTVLIREVARLQKERDTAESNEQQFTDERKESEKLTNERLRDWIRQLRRSEPAEHIIEDRAKTQEPWTYDDPEYDFFEQLHLVWLLAAGAPPRWLDGTPKIRQTLENEHGFPPTGPYLGWQAHLILSIAACHIIAFFIPLLVLTIKIFLMPRDLQIYYSRRHQAEAGDHEAWLSEVVDEKVKES